MFCMCSASAGQVIGGSKKKKRASGNRKTSRLATGATLETLAIYAATMKRKAEKNPLHGALKAQKIVQTQESSSRK